MNVEKIRAELDAAEQDKGTDHMLVKIIGPDGEFLNIDHVSVSTYRDGGEENHVVFLVAQRRG